MCEVSQRIEELYDQVAKNRISEIESLFKVVRSSRKFGYILIRSTALMDQKDQLYWAARFIFDYLGMNNEVYDMGFNSQVKQLNTGSRLHRDAEYLLSVTVPVSGIEKFRTVS